jgi:hypothetical protein
MAKAISNSGFPALLVDPVSPTESYVVEPSYRFKSDMLAWGVPLLIGLFCLVAAFVGWAVDPHRFYFAYLVAWLFCLTITLGALFFVMVHHITRSHWGIVVRRIPESLAWAFPLLAVLFIPVLFGLHDLFHWTHEEIYIEGRQEFDEILYGKRGYLKVPFWSIRVALYFIIWTVISYKLYKLSVRQDVDPDPTIPARQRKVSAWGIPVFAVTVAFASYDLLMSLDPHWFSTMFGVYFFAGAFWSANALIILIAVSLQRSGTALDHVVTKEHYHDLGKWLFAFTVFWTYVAFSQYMLIWAANLPEETLFYRHRLEDGWGWHSAVLLIGHFVVPFLLLLPRAIKRTAPLLAAIAVWALVMHWFDLHWIAMPNLHLVEEAAQTVITETGQTATAAHTPEVGGHAGFHWIDFAAWFGLFGVFLGAALWRLTRHSLVPQNDPRLGMSMAFHNI